MTGGGQTRENAGYRGTFVIPLPQTEIDGLPGATASVLFVGSQFRWRGEAVRIDGPSGLLTLDGAKGAEDLSRRAGRSVRRLLGDLGDRKGQRRAAADADCADFTLTDGCASYRMTLAGAGRLFAVSGPLPPRDTDLTVIENAGEPTDPVRLPGAAGGVICFVEGTLLATPDGLRPVEAIGPGDLVATRDGGAQEVLWTGHRHLSGARLFALPHLRPVRIRAGALGGGRPEGDLLVSPEHRLVLRGAPARDLFNEDEVLVAARDLIDGRTILTETRSRDVRYLHLMTARHEIVCANGVDAETFHPASADLALIASDERAALDEVAPGVEDDPFAYGAFARRCLSGPEAAILRYATA